VDEVNKCTKALERDVIVLNTAMETAKNIHDITATQFEAAILNLY